MSAIPAIPPAVRSIDQLDAWIDANAPTATTLAQRLRFTVAVMDRATDIGREQRGETSDAM